jgi:O-antigen/teichoic acid export membrane protein
MTAGGLVVLKNMGWKYTLLLTLLLLIAFYIFFYKVPIFLINSFKSSELLSVWLLLYFYVMVCIFGNINTILKKGQQIIKPILKKEATQVCLFFLFLTKY